MKFLLMIYTDDALLADMGEAEYAVEMRHCLREADRLRAEGTLLDFQQLEPAANARTVRKRDGSTRIIDGPFAETKEVLAGFNLIEADSLEEAERMAAAMPWTRTGSIEIRPVKDVAEVRRRVGADAG